MTTHWSVFYLPRFHGYLSYRDSRDLVTPPMFYASPFSSLLGPCSFVWVIPGDFSSSPDPGVSGAVIMKSPPPFHRLYISYWLLFFFLPSSRPLAYSYRGISLSEVSPFSSYTSNEWELTTAGPNRTRTSSTGWDTLRNTAESLQPGWVKNLEATCTEFRFWSTTTISCVSGFNHDAFLRRTREKVYGAGRKRNRSWTSGTQGFTHYPNDSGQETHGTRHLILI